MENYTDWKILKTELAEKQAEYSEVAEWCNENDYHIEEVGEYYQVVKNPVPEPPTIEEQVQRLELQYGMNRWQREGILAEGSLYSEYVKAKAQEIEDLAEQLRQ